MAVPDELRRHVADFEATTGIAVDIIENGTQIYLILREVALPLGAYATNSSDILFITDFQYPCSAMDMFWVEPSVVLPDGSIPQAAESIEPYAGRDWRRFSWHRNGVWNPASNGVLDHYELVLDRFSKDTPR